jgi:hypothetical protein
MVKIVTSTIRNVITIKDDKCWLCDKTFNKEVLLDRRTYHHAFPKRYHPVMNIKIPLCQECHYNINKEDEIYKKAYNTLRGMFLATEKSLGEKFKKDEDGKDENKS